MITYTKSNILYFSLKFGLWHCPKIVLRILYRKIFEHSPNVIVLGKTSKGKIVACGMGRVLPKNYNFSVYGAYIVGPVFVLPQERLKGIGCELVQSILDILGPNNIFYAYIHAQNKKSIRMFEKADFRKIGYMEKMEKKYYLVEHETSLVLMEKREENKQEG